MPKTLRLLLLTAAVATVALGGAARALACGNSTGYSYAGVGAPGPAHGISAIISPLNAFDILNGHVAGWVGVGGPGEGPGGTNEWLQIGYSGFPGVTGSDIYYEVAQPSHFPTYHQVAAALPVGTVSKVAVLEMHEPPELVARVAEPQARLGVRSTCRTATTAGARSPRPRAGTAGRAARATPSSTASATSAIANSAGGGWHQLTGGFPIQSAVTRVRRARGSAGFLAAEGRPAFQFLSATS